MISRGLGRRRRVKPKLRLTACECRQIRRSLTPPGARRSGARRSRRTIPVRTSCSPPSPWAPTARCTALVRPPGASAARSGTATWPSPARRTSPTRRRCRPDVRCTSGRVGSSSCCSPRATPSGCAQVEHVPAHPGALLPHDSLDASVMLSEAAAAAGGRGAEADQLGMTELEVVRANLEHGGAQDGFSFRWLSPPTPPASRSIPQAKERYWPWAQSGNGRGRAVDGARGARGTTPTPATRQPPSAVAGCRLLGVNLVRRLEYFQDAAAIESERARAERSSCRSTRRRGEARPARTRRGSRRAAAGSSSSPTTRSSMARSRSCCKPAGGRDLGDADRGAAERRPHFLGQRDTDASMRPSPLPWRRLRGAPTIKEEKLDRYVGKTMVIHGLVGRPELNGKRVARSSTRGGRAGTPLRSRASVLLSRQPAARRRGRGRGGARAGRGRVRQADASGGDPDGVARRAHADVLLGAGELFLHCVRATSRTATWPPPSSSIGATSAGPRRWSRAATTCVARPTTLETSRSASSGSATRTRPQDGPRVEHAGRSSSRTSLAIEHHRRWPAERHRGRAR